MAQSRDDLTAQFERYNDQAWNQGDPDALDGLFDEAVTVHDIPTEMTYDGRDAFTEWIMSIREAFPDFNASYDDDDIIIGETRVAIQWVASGTHEGHLPQLDIEPTGESVEFSGVSVYELDGETVTEAWWYYDMIDMLNQLGAVPEELPA